MGFDFPNNPSLNDEVTINGKIYKWDGVKWVNVRSHPVATQEEAEQGTKNDKYMTPLRTAQHTETHVSDEYPHKFVSEGIVYEWGVTMQDGEIGMIYREVNENE